MATIIYHTPYTMSTKSNLGQFYTTNYEYILQNMLISPEKHPEIIEPFAGNGDLIPFVESQGEFHIECYDIDPKKEYITQRDTLTNPPDYTGKYVITNPPFLARNKSKTKTLFDKYKTNDLYKCFIVNITENPCKGGIVILPINFMCSIRKSDVELRKNFLEQYRITNMNLFEERVFEDTTCTVCSIQFEPNEDKENLTHDFTIHVFPELTAIDVSLSPENNYTIGGEIYQLPQSEVYSVERATKKTKYPENTTNILLKCIDDNEESRINLSITPPEDRYIDETENLTARCYATLVVSPPLSPEEQENLVEKFNTFINEKRSEYHSLFLTNYRESKDIARKRISFDLAFKICSHILR